MTHTCLTNTNTPASKCLEMLIFRGVNTEEEKNARRPKTSPGQSPCSPEGQLRETPRAFSHDSSRYQADTWPDRDAEAGYSGIGPLKKLS